MEKILAVHNSHNSSICEIENDKIIYFQEAERIDKKKKSTNWFVTLLKYKNKNFNKIIFINASLHQDKDSETVLFKTKLNNLNIKADEIIIETGHHFFHACSAYFNSGFENSFVLISDGGGYTIDNSTEIVSLYYFNKNKFKKIFQLHSSANKEGVEKKDIYINTLSFGWLFEMLVEKWSLKEAGSLMGLSSYLKSSIKDNEYELTYFTKKLNHFQFKVAERVHNFYYSKTEEAFLVQKDLETIILKYVKNIIKNKNRNLCVSGGVFQNTVLNSKLLDICSNVYVDPFADDSGLSMGAALWYLNKNKFIKKEIKNLSLGDPPNLNILNLQIGYNVTYQDVAKILSEKFIVAIYQGRNELGKRALGNRSILFDPRDRFAKEKLNLLKNREWFRPTAGTVLEEYANEWFNLKSKKQTPFMSYVFKVKKDNIPGITHVDNTCRIQTVNQIQNYHYYNLIKEFYKITEVPILVNTSLNLAGKPLVNEIEDLIEIMTQDKLDIRIDYAYFPELGKMYHKKDF